MNTLVKAIVLSLSTALVAAPVMAAPQEHYNKSHQVQQHKSSPQHSVRNNQKQQHKSAAQKRVDPSRDWKKGQKVPAQYHSQSYKVDHRKYKKLSKPGKNQQWLKVNNDYVLTNNITHVILKIIAG